MARSRSKAGNFLIAGGVVVLGLFLFGKLFKWALFLGGVFVIWKLFFDREQNPKPTAAALPEPISRLDIEALTGEREREDDAERARLDRELEAAIAAKAAVGRLNEA